MYKYSYVYIMSDDRNERIYIGVTSNLLKRVWEHKNNIVDGYTRKYATHKLVYYEEFLDINAAITREKQLKGKLRRKKILLIDENNPEWIDLYYKILKDMDESPDPSSNRSMENYSGGR